jgi:hypothetical protein
MYSVHVVWYAPRADEVEWRSSSVHVWLQESSGEAGDEKKGLQQFHRLKNEAVEALRYRGEDVLKSLTKRAVREARARDLKLEILNCSKLQVQLHCPALFPQRISGYYTAHASWPVFLYLQHACLSCIVRCLALL